MTDWVRKHGGAVYLTALVLIVGAGSYWLSAAAVHRAAHASASVTQLCQAGNDARRQQIVLWSHFAAISKAPPHETPAQEAERKKQVASILAFIHRIFAARDCQHPGRTP